MHGFLLEELGAHTLDLDGTDLAQPVRVQLGGVLLARDEPREREQQLLDASAVIYALNLLSLPRLDALLADLAAVDVHRRPHGLAVVVAQRQRVRRDGPHRDVLRVVALRERHFVAGLVVQVALHICTPALVCTIFGPALAMQQRRCRAVASGRVMCGPRLMMMAYSRSSEAGGALQRCRRSEERTGLLGVDELLDGHAGDLERQLHGAVAHRWLLH